MMRPRIGPSLISCGTLAVLACLAASVFPTDLHGRDAPPVPIRLRFEWGGGLPHRWSGLLEISAGRLEQPVSLGVEADDARTLWIDDGALWIARNTQRVYDGFDVTVTAPPTAELTLTLQDARQGQNIGDGGSEPRRSQIRFRLHEIGTETRGYSLGTADGRLVIRRTPGDALAVHVDRPHLVFDPAERLTAQVEVNVSEKIGPQSRPRFDWRITPARSDSVLTRGSHPLDLRDVEAGQPFSFPLDLRVPLTEGVYDLRLKVTGNGFTSLESMVQFVVLSRRNGASAGGLAELSKERGDADGLRHSQKKTANRRETLIDKFHPDDAGLFRRVDPQGEIRLLSHSVGKLLRIKPPFVGEEREQPAWSDAEEQGTSGSSRTFWSAYKLRIQEPGEPHFLVVSVPTGAQNSVGISLVEPDAAGNYLPVGLDSGIYLAGSVQERPAPRNPQNLGVRRSPGSDQPAELIRHKIVFWPKVRQPILLLHNFGSGHPIDVSKVEVLRVEGYGQVPAQSRPTPTAGANDSGTEMPRQDGVDWPTRLVGPYLYKPMLAENFGATRDFDLPSRRSLDDWFTFYAAGRRLTDYLVENGYNSVLLTVFADGSAIYPSRVLEPSPRYDTGVFFSTGQDPLRKDVVELLYRLFNRAELTLIPALQFSAPLPDLERLRADDAIAARGIELIGADGRSWRESHAAVRGLAPCYNPLDPRVQQAVEAALREFVERYRHHASFGGLAVELTSQGYLQFPGLDWGYDDETVARFEQATGIAVPTGNGNDRFTQRHAFLTGDARGEWIRWRCRELADFHHRLAKIVTDAKPSARFVLAGNRVLRNLHPDEPAHEHVKSGGNLTDLLLLKGLDFNLSREVERFVVLRPALWTAPNDPLINALDESINTNPALDAVFSSPQPGSLFFHLPQTFRIREFDAVSPWQPAYTWLVSQPSATGADNRRRFSRSLAALDAQMVFDGGWMIPLGQEASSRPVRDVIRALPSVTFHPAAHQKQPAVVRIAHFRERTFVYVVNQFPEPIHVTLGLSSSPETTGRFLGGDTSSARGSRLKLTVPLPSPKADEKPESGAQSPEENGAEDSADGFRSSLQSPVSKLQAASSELRLEIESYGVVALELDDADARITEVAAGVPRELLAWMQEQINRLEIELTAIRKSAGPKPSLLENPGFENPPNDRHELPGWDIPGTGGVEWAIDNDNPHSGTSSLMLVGGEKEAAVLSAPVPAQGHRTLTMNLWLKSDLDDADVQLAFEGLLNGRRQVQRAGVRVDRQWRRYVLRVQEIPTEALQEARIRIEMRSPGRLWVDDVDVQLQKLSADDLRQLTKTFSVLELAWQQERYADCYDILQSYWGLFPFTSTFESRVNPISAVPSQSPAESTRGER